LPSSPAIKEQSGKILATDNKRTPDVPIPTAGQTINEMPPGVFKTLNKVRPAGALQARKQTTGAVSFFWRYSIGERSERVPIGLYDPGAAPKSMTPTSRGYSVAAAIRAAEALAIEHHQHRDEGGRPALVQAKRQAAQEAEEARRAAADHTLENLLTAYCDYLESLGRRSHRDARSIFKLHVVEAWPKVAATPAKDVTGEQFADMMRRLIESGKGRTANKLRSYARAAYQVAKSAKSKPSIPLAFKEYGIVANPVGETEPDESQNRPDKRPMTADEMRVYWRAIKNLPGIRGASLRLHLLTGGQRIEQLVNLRTSDVRPDELVLYDGKGRPGRPPRPHVVPLTKAAAKALAGCKPKGEYALSTDGGETHIAATTLSAWAVEAARDIIEEFQAKRIRSGVETLLAAARVSQEIRGRLQSHGIAGVQARHYDGHDYLEEKRAALEALQKALFKRA
jgi:integrase